MTFCMNSSKCQLSSQVSHVTAGEQSADSTGFILSRLQEAEREAETPLRLKTLCLDQLLLDSVTSGVKILSTGSESCWQRGH